MRRPDPSAAFLVTVVSPNDWPGDAPLFILNLFDLMAYAMFFFAKRDGEKILEKIFSLSASSVTKGRRADAATNSHLDHPGHRRRAHS